MAVLVSVEASRNETDSCGCRENEIVTESGELDRDLLEGEPESETTDCTH